MARISYQKGRIEQRERKHGVVYVLRYRLRQGDKWIEKTEEIGSFKSPKEAQRAADERMIEINQINNNPASMTVSSFVLGPWKSYVENRAYKPSTAYIYGTMIDRFIHPLPGDKQLEGLKPKDITVFFDKVREMNTGQKQIFNLYGLLRLMFGIALEFDIIENNPVRPKLHRPRYQSKEKRALSVEQIQRVIACVQIEYKPLVICAALTGLRIGEILALKWQDIDFDRLVLSVNHNLWQGQLVTPKTKSSKQTLRLSEPLAAVLQSHYEYSRWKAATDWVFAREDGSYHNPDTLRFKVLYPAMERAGIVRIKSAHGFHVFRHSAGSLVHAQTKDLKMAQEFLRHSSIDTTADIYVHIDEAMAGEATEAIISNCGPRSRDNSVRERQVKAVPKFSNGNGDYRKVAW